MRVREKGGEGSYLNRVGIEHVHTGPASTCEDQLIALNRARTEPLRDQIRPKHGVARHNIKLRNRYRIGP